MTRPSSAVFVSPWASAIGSRPLAIDHGPGRDEKASSTNTTRRSYAKRQIAETLLQLREIDIEHHDDEKEQNRHRADIDNDQNHRQKFRAKHQEKPGRINEGENKKENRMNRIARRDDHEVRRS